MSSSSSRTMENKMIKLFLVAICFQLIACNIDTEYADSLQSLTSMNDDSVALRAQKKFQPARKPPRFGKRGLVLMLSPYAATDRIRLDGKHLKKDLDSDYEKQLATEWSQRAIYDRPYYSNKYLMR